MCIRTAFDPDEYWQAPEVAHRLVFGCATSCAQGAPITAMLLEMRRQRASAILAPNHDFCPAAQSRRAKPDTCTTALCCRYGYLTWEWAAGLRSYLHPLLFTPAYWLLAVLRVDSAQLVQLAPRITQAALACAHDAVHAAFVRAHSPAPLRRAALAVSALAWFNNFTHPRPFSNCLESTLHLACLCCWPLPWQDCNTAAQTGHVKRRGQADTGSNHPGAPPVDTIAGSRRWRAAALCCAGCSCIIRPTGAVLYVPLALLALARPAAGSQAWRERLRFVADAAVLCMAFLGGSAANDRACYGRWVVPAWQNLKFNVLRSGSAAYGEHPWHWYATQGLPAMLASLLPLVAVGLAQSYAGWRCAAGTPAWPLGATKDELANTVRSPAVMPLWPAALACWGIVVHSLIAHKEFRFVLPSYELLLLYAAGPLECALRTVLSEGKQRSQGSTLHNEATDDGAQSVLKRAMHSSGPLTRRQAQLQHGTAGKRRGAVDSTDDTQAQGPEVAPRGSAAAKRCNARVLAPELVAWLVVMLLALQLPMLAYFGVWHQRGTVAVAEWLSRQHAYQVRLPIFGLPMQGSNQTDMKSLKRHSLDFSVCTITLIGVCNISGAPTRSLPKS